MDIKNIAEVVSKLSPLISILLTAFIIPFNNFQNRKKNKITNVKEIEFLIDKLDDKFRRDFILKNFKENFFFLQTGIETNEKSIESYIKLKDKLKANYTWKKIKMVTPYLKFENTEIHIELKKIQVFFAKIVTVLSFLFFASSVIILFYLSIDVFYFSTIDYLKLFTLASLPLICGIYLINIITPLNIAIAIQKKLNNNTQ